MTNPDFAAAIRRFPVRLMVCAVFIVLPILLPLAAAAQQSTTGSVVLDTMTAELHRAFTSLGRQASSGQDSDKQLPPYFLSYTVSDSSSISIRAQYGALAESASNHLRIADVQVRLGNPDLDNTHGSHRGTAVNSLQLPVTR